MGNCCTGEERGTLDDKEVTSPSGVKLRVASRETAVDDFGREVSPFFNLNADQKAAIVKYKLEILTPENRSAVTQITSGLIKYEGQTAGSQKEGVGHLLNENGDFIVCHFKKDKAEGDGAIYYKNGDYYKGKISNNDAHGKGVFWYKDGRKYEGAFANGHKSGYGVINWLDGSKYEGQWDKVQNGHGKYTTAKGQVIEGEFANGKKLK